MLEFTIEYCCILKYFCYKERFFFRCCKFWRLCRDVSGNSFLWNDAAVLLNQILTVGEITVSSFQSSKCPHRAPFRCVQVTAFPLSINNFFWSA
jgi:hypothetical protein